MAEIERERRESSAARVPAVPPGKAIVVTRYGEEKAVVLNPEDFHRLNALERDLDELAAGGPTLSELALKAHELEDTPGTAVEDAEQIRALLGL
jgi:PHD/YefM family antitoxin component YafN of YafNO toxin-antitoxin module